MGSLETLWEPTWDFHHPVAPLVPADLPYSLEDPTYLGFLKNNFQFGMQLCLPVYDRLSRRLFWHELADQAGHNLILGKYFWKAIGVADEAIQRKMTARFQEPYFGMIDIGTWQGLREVFGLPEEGILYADFVDSRYLNRDLSYQTSDGYSYFAGTCSGETTEGVFETDSGASCCWVSGEWFIAVDLDLTRGVICYNSASYTAALYANKELECYPLWPSDTTVSLTR